MADNKVAAFVAFTARHGAPAQPLPASQEELGYAASLLPGVIVDYWRTHGFGSYMGGALWMHPPRSLADVVEEWVDQETARTTAVIARSSFGDLLLWHNGQVQFLEVQLGRVTELGEDVTFVFDHLLCQDDFASDVLSLPEHEKCVARLGALTRSECFAFVPIRALGGSGELDTVQRAPLREHLALLAQSIGLVELR